MSLVLQLFTQMIMHIIFMEEVLYVDIDKLEGLT